MRTLKFIEDAPGVQTFDCERLNVAPDGKRFVCDFIEAGLIDYSDAGSGIEYLRDNAIEEGLPSLIGSPVTIGHVSTRLPKKGPHAHGEIDKAYRNKVGGFTCEGPIHTEEGRQRAKTGKVSIGFIAKRFGDPGRFNNIPYVQSIEQIVFHHLAIGVENPRITESKIRLNALNQKSPVKIIKWLSEITRAKADGTGEEKVTQTGELAPETTIEVDGKAVRLCDMTDAFTAKQKADADAAAAKKKKDDEDAAKTRQNEIRAGDFVEIEGQKVLVSDLVTVYRNKPATTVPADRQNEVEKKEGEQAFKILAAAKDERENSVTITAVDDSTLTAGLARGKKYFGSSVADVAK